jgi:Ca-activated chloride channel homolog
MTFAWPQLLWLLLIPAGLLTWELVRRRRVAAATAHPKILRAEVGTHELSLSHEPASTAAHRARPWLMIGLSFGVVALARPQWGRIEEPVFDQSREILLAVDLSRSMLSPDVKPSRLERTKLLIQALLEKLQGERVGLVVFSGTAFLQSPLSSDYEILREFLPSLGPDFLPEGGTNYGAMISTALDAFGTTASADRFLIVLSDGEATDENWDGRVDELKKRGIRVIALGVGTAAGSMIPDPSGGFVKDERGAVVLSKLESGTLQKLADMTGGVYHDASAWIDLAALVDQTVNTGKKGNFVDKAEVRYIERFQWPLALALWCLLVSFYYEFPIRPRPRAITLRAETGQPSPQEKTSNSSPASTAALMLSFLLIGVGALVPRAHAAVKVAPLTTSPGSNAANAPAPEPPPLGKIIGRLAQKDSLTAPDLSEVAHETLSWGRKLKESGQPVPDGPVRDALDAVDRLEAMNDKLADWTQLRKDLEALREKPPQPPPQQQPQQNQQQNQQQQNKDQSKQDQKSDSADKQNQPPQSDQQKDQAKANDSSQAQSKSEDQKPKSDEQKPNNAAFGEMNKSQPPSPPSQETQTVGGAQPKKDQQQPTDPALALPLERLDQLKNQDSPAQLFQLMQGDRNQAARKKPTKDW